MGKLGGGNTKDSHEWRSLLKSIYEMIIRDIERPLNVYKQKAPENDKKEC